MGSFASKSNYLLKYNPNEWTQIQSQNGYDILKHTYSTENQQEFAQLWTVKLTSDNIKMDDQKMLQMYQLRSNNDFPVIRCFGIEEKEKKSVGLCGSEKILRVLTERIILRFNQFPQLMFPECCYIIREALAGYLSLYKKVGPFQVTQKMMGINEQGNFKVWLHENFGMIQPTTQSKTTLNKQNAIQDTPIISESDMVSNILHTIQQKCEQGAYPFQIRSQLYGNQRGFRSVNDILQAYCSSQKLQIPDRIHPNIKCIIQKNITNNSSIGFEEQSSVVGPCDPNQLKNFHSNTSSQKNIKKVVNFIQLQPKPSPNKKSRIVQGKNNHPSGRNHPNYPNHPNQLRGKQRIVQVPQTIIRRLDTPQSHSPRRIYQKNNPNPQPIPDFFNQMTTPKLQNHLKSETYNFLRGNPNIMAVQSVYQPLHKEQSVKLNEHPPLKSNKHTDSYFHQELVQSEYFQSSNNFFPKQNRQEQIHPVKIPEKINNFSNKNRQVVFRN